jgi:hypothetical protein
MNIFSFLNNQKFKITFNWINLLIIFFFYNYSFYGIGTKFQNTFYNITFEILLFIILSLFYFIPLNINNKFNDYLKFNLKEVLVFFSIFILLFLIIGYKYFSISLTGDSISHSYGSIYHSSYISYTLYNLNKFSYKIGDLIFLINWAIFLFFYSFFKIVLKNKNFYKYIFLVLLFFAIRLFFYKIGGINNFHPPGRYLFLFLSTLLSGVYSYTFRIPQIISLILIFYNIFHFTNKFFNVIISLLLSFCIITIPVLLYSSYIVEQSIYTTLILILVLIEIQKNPNEINFARLFTLSSIFILIRQPILGVFIFVFLSYYWFVFKKKIIISHIIIFYPALLIIPFYFSVFFIGNPAYNSENELHFTLIQKFILFFDTKIYFISAINHIYFYLIFIPLFFLYFKDNKIVYFLFLIITLEFFSIRPILWGIGRYQVEYMIPFIFFGFLFLLKLIKRNNTLIICFLGVLIFINIFIFNNIYLINNKINSNNKNYFSSIKKPFKNFIISDFPIPINEALTNFKSIHPNKFIVLDNSNSMYGEMPLILNNYSLDLVVESRRINFIDSNLQYILSERNVFKKGWIIESEIINKYNFGSLYLYKKSN